MYFPKLSGPSHKPPEPHTHFYKYPSHPPFSQAHILGLLRLRSDTALPSSAEIPDFLTRTASGHCGRAPPPQTHFSETPGIPRCRMTNTPMKYTASYPRPGSDPPRFPTHFLPAPAGKTLCPHPGCLLRPARSPDPSLFHKTPGFPPALPSREIHFHTGSEIPPEKPSKASVSFSARTAESIPS